MSDRMTKELVIAALQDAIGRTGKSGYESCILHSDMESQYCSARYRRLLQSYGMVSSMSRRGNCWDNSPMESFWGKLKQDWLNHRRFKTRDEARSVVHEYIWTFYNRERPHSTNGGLSPDEYFFGVQIAA